MVSVKRKSLIKSTLRKSHLLANPHATLPLTPSGPCPIPVLHRLCGFFAVELSSEFARACIHTHANKCHHHPFSSWYVQCEAGCAKDEKERRRLHSWVRLTERNGTTKRTLTHSKTILVEKAAAYGLLDPIVAAKLVAGSAQRLLELAASRKKSCLRSYLHKKSPAKS